MYLLGSIIATLQVMREEGGGGDSEARAVLRMGGGGGGCAHIESRLMTRDVSPEPLVT